MKAIICGQEFPCDKAVRGDGYVRLYDGDACVASFDGVSDFTGFSIEGGEWSSPEPTQLDRTEAQAMYTAMMTDTLIEEDEDDV